VQETVRPMQRKGPLLCLPNLTYRFYACRQLYITTISEEGDDASPDSGKLFVVDLEGARGAGGAHKYSGRV
jgi:hypothetical protein